MNSNSFSNPYQTGFQFEKEYHGCAQCAVAALYDVFPELTKNEVFRATSGLGGGVGLSCKGHCGALSGAVMVISQLFGRELNAIEDPEKKKIMLFDLPTKWSNILCGRS